MDLDEKEKFSSARTGGEMQFLSTVARWLALASRHRMFAVATPSAVPGCLSHWLLQSYQTLFDINLMSLRAVCEV